MAQQELILVVGHKNPDTDTVVSAIAYAKLKEALGIKNIKPATVGEINNETRFVLEYFGVESPEVIDDFYLRVEDVMSSPAIVIDIGAPIKDVLDIVKKKGFMMVPIGKDLELKGVIDITKIAAMLVAEMDIETDRQVNTTAKNILQCLNGTLIVGHIETVFPNGNLIIGAMAVSSMSERIRTYYGFDNIVLLGDREDAQIANLEAGVRCLIITGGFSPTQTVVDLAKTSGATLIVSPYDTITSVRLTKLSASVETLMNTNITGLTPDTRISEAKGIVINSPARSMPVVDEFDKVIGVVTARDLLQTTGKKVILVDHNEIFQAGAGIEEAEIIEIIDHHRTGDIQSRMPIPFTGEPVGSTATLIATKYDQHFISPSKEIAGLLLAGILSDTLLFKSSTTTQKDMTIAKKLALGCGVEINTFGIEMFRHGSMLEEKSVKEIIMANYKEYKMGNRNIGIGQFETVDTENILKLRDAFGKELNDLKEAHKLELVMMLITDILKEGSHLIFVGNFKIIELAFETDRDELFLKGILSRKKQVLPAIGKALKLFYQEG
ncbi:MAG: putative manganese-dependent inorganic diphosphatase [bacterium]|nr:putative manganese-dependent inorganic diphosphatase [bacterium]